MTPQVAYMQTLGLETMEVRYARQAGSCLQPARGLQDLDGIGRLTIRIGVRSFLSDQQRAVW